MGYFSEKNAVRFLNNLKSWISGKFVEKQDGKGLSSNDYTTAEKEKLEGLQNTTVDSTLSSSSVNPVQNKVINAALGGESSYYQKGKQQKSLFGRYVSCR